MPAPDYILVENNDDPATPIIDAVGKFNQVAVTYDVASVLESSMKSMVALTDPDPPVKVGDNPLFDVVLMSEMWLCVANPADDMPLSWGKKAKFFVLDRKLKAMFYSDSIDDGATTHRVDASQVKLQKSVRGPQSAIEAAAGAVGVDDPNSQQPGSKEDGLALAALTNNTPSDLVFSVGPDSTGNTYYIAPKCVKRDNLWVEWHANTKTKWIDALEKISLKAGGIVAVNDEDDEDDDDDVFEEPIPSELKIVKVVQPAEDSHARPKIEYKGQIHTVKWVGPPSASLNVHDLTWAPDLPASLGTILLSDGTRFYNPLGEPDEHESAYKVQQTDNYKNCDYIMSHSTYPYIAICNLVQSRDLDIQGLALTIIQNIVTQDARLHQEGRTCEEGTTITGARKNKPSTASVWSRQLAGNDPDPDSVAAALLVRLHKRVVKVWNPQMKESHLKTFSILTRLVENDKLGTKKGQKGAWTANQNLIEIFTAQKDVQFLDAAFKFINPLPMHPKEYGALQMESMLFADLLVEDIQGQLGAKTSPTAEQAVKLIVEAGLCSAVGDVVNGKYVDCQQSEDITFEAAKLVDKLCSTTVACFLDSDVPDGAEPRNKQINKHRQKQIDAFIKEAKRRAAKAIEQGGPSDQAQVLLEQDKAIELESNRLDKEMCEAIGPVVYLEEEVTQAGDKVLVVKHNRQDSQGILHEDRYVVPAEKWVGLPKGVTVRDNHLLIPPGTSPIDPKEKLTLQTVKGDVGGLVRLTNDGGHTTFAAFKNPNLAQSLLLMNKADKGLLLVRIGWKDAEEVRSDKMIELRESFGVTEGQESTALVTTADFADQQLAVLGTLQEQHIREQLEGQCIASLANLGIDREAQDFRMKKYGDHAAVIIGTGVKRKIMMKRTRKMVMDRRKLQLAQEKGQLALVRQWYKYKARCEYHIRKFEKTEHDSITMIQRLWRGNKGRKDARKFMDEQRKYSQARRIQCAFRTFLAWQTFQKVRHNWMQRRANAVTRIIAKYRAWHVRYKRKQILAVQAISHRYLIHAKHVMLRRQRRMQLVAAMAMRIQLAWKSSCARQLVNSLRLEDYEEAMGATIKLQRWYARRKEYRDLIRLLKEFKITNRAIKMQKAWRCHTAKRYTSVLRGEKLQHTSALTIQRVFRGGRGREIAIDKRIARRKQNRLREGAGIYGTGSNIRGIHDKVDLSHGLAHTTARTELKAFGMVQTKNLKGVLKTKEVPVAKHALSTHESRNIATLLAAPKLSSPSATLTAQNFAGAGTQVGYKGKGTFGGATSGRQASPHITPRGAQSSTRTSGMMRQL